MPPDRLTPGIGVAVGWNLDGRTNKKTLGGACMGRRWPQAALSPRRRRGDDRRGHPRTAWQRERLASMCQTWRDGPPTVWERWGGGWKMTFRPLAISRQHKVGNFVLFVCTTGACEQNGSKNYGPVSTKLSEWIALRNVEEWASICVKSQWRSVTEQQLWWALRYLHCHLQISHWPIRLNHAQCFCY